MDRVHACFFPVEPFWWVQAHACGARTSIGASRSPGSGEAIVVPRGSTLVSTKAPKQMVRVRRVSSVQPHPLDCIAEGHHCSVEGHLPPDIVAKLPHSHSVSARIEDLVPLGALV